MELEDIFVRGRDLYSNMSSEIHNYEKRDELFTFKHVFDYEHFDCPTRMVTGVLQPTVDTTTKRPDWDKEISRYPYKLEIKVKKLKEDGPFPETAVLKYTQEEMDIFSGKAYDNGKADGRKEGYQDGYVKGHERALNKEEAKKKQAEREDSEQTGLCDILVSGEEDHEPDY